MEPYSGKLQARDGWVPALVKAPPAPGGDRAVLAMRPAGDLADRLYRAETFQPEGRSPTDTEPFSLQWYLAVERARYGRHGAWVPRLLEFAKHAGESVLGLGEGLGTDWAQYARHAASVTVCCASTDQLVLVERNFDLRGLRGKFLHATPASLPVESSSIDVVCLSGLLAQTKDPGALVAEIYRVLKPGGKALAVTHAYYDVAYWRRKLMPWQAWWEGGRSQGPGTTEGLKGRALRRLFDRFTEPRLSKRHLRRRDVPHLWRWLPHPILQRLFGRFLIFKGFKPVSAATALHAVAG